MLPELDRNTSICLALQATARTAVILGYSITPLQAILTGIALLLTSYIAFLLQIMLDFGSEADTRHNGRRASSENQPESASAGVTMEAVSAVSTRAQSLATSLFDTVAHATGLASPERPRSAGTASTPEGSKPHRRTVTAPVAEGVKDRPRRLMRPIRPPPLAELQLKPTPQDACFFTRAIANEIRNLLPQRLQVHDCWQCLFNLNVHGVSIATLYHRLYAYRDRLGERPGFVIAVKDGNGQIFGAYINEFLRPEPTYFGTGECFLWKVQTIPPAAGQESATMRFKAFPWTGLNDYQMYCTHDFISFGGGNGKYGLWLDDRLEHGVSGASETFGNEALCDSVEEGRRFDVLSVEVWKV